MTVELQAASRTEEQWSTKSACHREDVRKRVLVAGVGYTNMRDLSVGPVLVPALRQVDWPPGVEVQDLSFGPIAVVQWLQERPGYFDRAVFLSAVTRGREPGRVYAYCWDGVLPDREEVQRRVGEAVTGVISLDNLLIIARYFDALPAQVRVVEVEPVETGWGLGFSPRVKASLPEVMKMVRQAVLDGWA